jgi:hypothetical protein
MNQLQRVETHSSIGARSTSVPIGRKLASAFLTMLMASVMIVWFGYLARGVVELAQWGMHHIRGIWSHTR